MNRMTENHKNKFQLSTGAIFIGLICLVAYAPAVRCGFVWDDDAMLTENSVLRENGLYRSWFSAAQPNYWPMTWTSYWLEHKLWGLAPEGYHITNILIHIACTLLIWRILIRLNIPAAFAAKGRFDEAAVTAQKSLDIAVTERNDRLANLVRRQMEMYKQRILSK